MTLAVGGTGLQKGQKQMRMMEMEMEEEEEEELRFT